MGRHDQLRAFRHPATVEELWDQAVLGLRTDVIPLSVNGFNVNLTNVLTEISNNSTIKAFPDNAIEYFAVSTDNADVDWIQITGLDENKEYKQEYVELNGTTPVSLGNWFRIWQAETGAGQEVSPGQQAPANPVIGDIIVYEAGSSGSKTDAKSMAVMIPTVTADENSAGERSYNCFITIPKGYSGYVFGFNAISGRNDEVLFVVQARIPNGVWQTIIPEQYFESTQSRQLKPRYIPELSDIRVLASKAGGEVVPMTFAYQALLLENKSKDN